jgi:hypothetical protein
MICKGVHKGGSLWTVVGLLRHSLLLVCPKAILAAAEARHLTQGPPGKIHGRQSGERRCWDSCSWQRQEPACIALMLRVTEGRRRLAEFCLHLSPREATARGANPS